MPRSSDASSLHLDFSIITFLLFLIRLAFKLGLMHVKLQNSILNISKYRKLFLYCVNSLWTIHFRIRYLLYGIPIQKVQLKSSIGRLMYVKGYLKMFSIAFSLRWQLGSK